MSQLYASFGNRVQKISVYETKEVSIFDMAIYLWFPFTHSSVGILDIFNILDINNRKTIIVLIFAILTVI